VESRGSRTYMRTEKGRNKPCNSAFLMTKIGNTDMNSTIPRRSVDDHGIRNAETAACWLVSIKRTMMGYVSEVQAERTRCNKRQNTMNKPLQSSVAEQDATGGGSGPVSWPERQQMAQSLSAAFPCRHCSALVVLSETRTR